MRRTLAEDQPFRRLLGAFPRPREGPVSWSTLASDKFLDVRPSGNSRNETTRYEYTQLIAGTFFCRSLAGADRPFVSSGKLRPALTVTDPCLVRR